MVLERSLDPDGGFPIFDSCRRDTDALWRDAQFRRTDQPDIAVDAPAGIPAGRRLRIVQAHSHDIVTLLQRRCQLDLEGSISIRPASDFDAVAIHHGPGHRPVDTQTEFLLQILRGQREMLPVPGLSPPGQLPGLAGIRLLERLLHAPVVGQCDRAPARIDALRRGIALRDETAPVQHHEFPIIVEGHTARRLRGERQGGQHRSQQQDDSSHKQIH